MSGKSKLIHYKTLAQKILISKLEYSSFVIKNNGQAAIYFKTFIKNQIMQLEKRFKEAQKNLGIINSSFPNKDAI